MSNKYDIVNDASKFLKLSSDPTLRREGNLQRFLSTLKNKYFFTKEQCDNIYAFWMCFLGSQLWHDVAAAQYMQE